jgi:hypothetical protein
MSTTSVTTPTWTRGTAVRAAATLAAGASANYNVNWLGKIGGVFHVKFTPTGTVAGTNGLKVEVFRRFGATPTTAARAFYPVTIPAVASTTDSVDIPLDGDHYNIKITNLDATNDLNNVEIVADTIDSLDTATTEV